MNISIPEGFDKIINDFICDIQTTFPEYNYLIKKIWITDYDSEFLHVEDPELRKNVCQNDKEDKLRIIYNHCIRIFPERFFDIIYQNKDIFNDDSIINTEFLPRIVFKHLWNSDDITDKTRETIWKYLQLILMTIVSSIDNKNTMGDTAKLFEAINEDELKSKLEETIQNIQSLFSEQQQQQEQQQQEQEQENNTYEQHEEEEQKTNDIPLPNADYINSHLKGMLDGKLGKLAMELAEETSKDLNLDSENITNTGDIFKQMFKNPNKLMNIMKNIGDKIDTKLKSGEISETELMTEGIELLNKMKGNGNMGSMQDLFKQFGMGGDMSNLANMMAGAGGGGKNQKVNIGSMQNKMQQHLKEAKLKEKIKKHLEEKNKQPEENVKNIEYIPKYTDDELIQSFSSNDVKPKKSMRIPLPENTVQPTEPIKQTGEKKNKKNKKKN
jgi:hypothetical protein